MNLIQEHDMAILLHVVMKNYKIGEIVSHEWIVEYLFKEWQKIIDKE